MVKGTSLTRGSLSPVRRRRGQLRFPSHSAPQGPDQLPSLALGVLLVVTEEPGPQPGDSHGKLRPGRGAA